MYLTGSFLNGSNLQQKIWLVIYLHNPQKCIARSNHLQVFCKKGILKNFVKFSGKDQCQRVSQLLSCKFG